MTSKDREFEARLKAQEKRIAELERKLTRKNKISSASVWESERIWADQDVMPGQMIMSPTDGPHFMGDYSIDGDVMRNNGAIGQHYHYHNNGNDVDLALQLDPVSIFTPVDISASLDFADPPAHAHVLDFSDGVNLNVPLGPHLLIWVRVSWGQNVGGTVDSHNYDKAIKIVKLGTSGSSDGDIYSTDETGVPLSYWLSDDENSADPLALTGLNEATFYTTNSEMKLASDVDHSAATQTMHIIDRGTWQIRYYHSCDTAVLAWFSIKVANLGNWRFP